MSLTARLVLASVWLLGVGCSITHKSGDFACDKPTDCAPDRTCSNGYCVAPGLPDDAPNVPNVDAPTPIDAPIPVPCPPQCTSCNPATNACTITCGPANNNCSGAVTCPTGWNCEIDCGVTNACRAGVNCLGSASCHVLCTGFAACRNVTCGTGKCEVECAGINSCQRGIQCGNSCACDVSCTGGGQQTCGQVSCDPIACDTLDGGCSSTPLFANQQCSTDCL
jgi:hypothetical protein